MLRVWGLWVCRWGAPRAAGQVPPPPPRRLGSEAPGRHSCRAFAHQRRGWLSLAPPFARGLGLRRWSVPWAVALVAEGGAQGPGHPHIGLRVRDAQQRPPFQKGRPPWPPVRPSSPNHIPEYPLVVLAGRSTPGVNSTFPPSLRRSTVWKGPFLILLVVPELAQISQSYTSITRGRASPSRVSESLGPNRAGPPGGRGPFPGGGGYPPPAPAPPVVPLPPVPAPQRPPALPGRQPSAPAPPVAPVRRRGCAQRGQLGRGGGWRGAGGLGGRSGPPCRGRCCGGFGGVGGRGRHASAEYRGECTVPPGLPAAGAPCPHSPVRHALLPPPPVAGPRPACPRWLTSPPPSLPLGALSTTGLWPSRALSCLPPCPCIVSPPLSPAPLPFPPVLAPVPFPCHCPCPVPCPVSLPPLPAPCLPRAPAVPRCRLRRVPARAPCRVLCPSFRCPCPCLFRAPALPRCRRHWPLNCAHSPSRRRVHPGPSTTSVPWRCCWRLRPSLVPVLLLRLPPSRGCRLLLAPRPRGRPPS